MENKNRRYVWLPYTVAVAAFALLCAVYFSPQFEGRALRMHDIVQYEGAAQDSKAHSERYGEDPQWTGNSFSGMPTVLTTMDFKSQIIKKSFPVLEFMGRPASLIFLAMLCFFIMLVMFGMNPWVGIVPALAYGLSTYFFLIIGAGHITKMIALAFAPLVVGGVFYTLRRNMWPGAALTALFASLDIAAGHPQITYYFGFIILALWINECVRAVRKKLLPRFAKATGLLVVAAVLALGSNLAPLWYINEYSGDSIRGGSELATDATGKKIEKRNDGLSIEYATAGWSYGKLETFNLLIPKFMGGSSMEAFEGDGAVAQAATDHYAKIIAEQERVSASDPTVRAYAQDYGKNTALQMPTYWGTQRFTAGPTYLGAAAIFLAVLGLMFYRLKKTLWIAAVSILAILLSWGDNFLWFTELFFYYFPGYNKFRTVAMILVIVQWSVPFLAAMAIWKLWRGGEQPAVACPAQKAVGQKIAAKKGGKMKVEMSPEDKRMREKVVSAVKYSVAILGGLTLVFILFGGWLFDLMSPAEDGLPPELKKAIKSERLAIMRADAWRSLFFVAASAGVVLLYGFRKIGRGVLLALLAVLVVADMVVVNLRYLSNEQFVEQRQTAIVASDIDKEILKDKELGYRVFNMRGAFNDAETSYFHRSVGGYHGAKMQRYQDIIDRYFENGSAGMYDILDMLNTKYIIQYDRNTRTEHLEVNPGANGAAWFVDKIIMAATPDEEIALLGGLNNKHEAVVDERFANLISGVDLAADSTRSIELTDYRANRLTYRYNNSRESVAVFSEIYYDKGWEAFIDGQPAPHFRVDYILRGMHLPAGEHVVEFRFRARNFGLISNITLIFSLLIIASVVAAAVAAILCKKGKRGYAAEHEITA